MASRAGPGRAPRIALVLVALATPAIACGLFPDVSDLEGPASSEAGSASESGAADVTNDVAADALAISDGGCDADLSSSSNHCGACGHSCFGGGCVDAQCLPVALATAEPSPYGLAIDDASVYWTQEIDGGKVRKIAKDGDASTLATVVGNLPAPQFLAVDDTFVYVTNVGGPLMRVPKAGATTPKVLTPSYAGMHEVAVDDSVVYFTDQQDAGGVYFVSKDGGSPTTFAYSGGPASIAIDGQYVYWCEASSTPGQGVVNAKPKGNPGATPINLGYGQQNPDGIAIDASNVYWTLFSQPGGVGKHPKTHDSAPGMLLDSNTAMANGIAVNGSFVYFTSYANGTVNRVSVNGGPVTILAQVTGSPIRIAVDDTFIYWTSNAQPTGGVYRLAK